MEELVDQFVRAESGAQQTDVSTRLKLLVQDHASFGVTLEATCALVEEVIQTTLASTVHQSFAAEEVGEWADIVQLARRSRRRCRRRAQGRRPPHALAARLSTGDKTGRCVVAAQ